MRKGIRRDPSVGLLCDSVRAQYLYNHAETELNEAKKLATLAAMLFASLSSRMQRLAYVRLFEPLGINFDQFRFLSIDREFGIETLCTLDDETERFAETGADRFSF